MEVVMKKKVMAALLAGFMALSLAACGGSSSSSASAPAEEKTESTVAADGQAAPAEASGDQTHIYVLTASEDHGWTGSVATFAKAKVEEVNAEGTYSAELITSASAAEQITTIEDIISKGEKNIAIVVQPLDDTVQSAIQQIVDAGIPYVAFDRIIAGLESTAVSNVKGDNAGIGAAAAAYFVELGMKPGDKVYVYEGDTSSVTALRDQGFTDYLTGAVDYNGETIADDAKWTEDDIKAITYSGAMNWSRSDTKSSFESLMGDSANADIKWFYSEDDELGMGILEALAGGGIDDATKTAFLGNQPVITGCGGLGEFYDVLKGTSYADISEQLGGIMSVTYSPSMIKTAIQDMEDYLAGKDVEQDHVIACEIVTGENVDNYEAFN